MIEDESNMPPEVQAEMIKFEFEQKMDTLNIDTKMLTIIGKNLDHYEDLTRAKFESTDQGKINEALLQMLDLHKDQESRPDGMPYISHPLEVSRTIVEDFDSKDIELIQASLLHDSVEDQGIKLAEEALIAKYGNIEFDTDFEKAHRAEVRAFALAKITETYGDRVAGIVDKLSSPDFGELAKKDTDPQDKEKFQVRKHELYKEHVEESIKDPDVFVVKLADFLHNFTNVATLEDSPQKRKYIQKYVPVAQVFIEHLSQDSTKDIINNKDVLINKLEETVRALS